MRLTSKKLRTEAQNIIKEIRNNPKHIYTDREISKSNHPTKTCELCGQLGCDVKYAEKYLHKKCYRILKKISKKLSK